MARLCNAGGDLRAEIDAAWPKRDRASDGWLGDAAHRNTVSDHNPNSAGVVRAIDVDVDGVPIVKLVERFRALGKANDRRVKGGYVIYNRRIAGSHTSWEWRTYTGSNPHTLHAHFSFGDAASDYDHRARWGVAALAAPSHTHATPSIQLGSSGSAVKDLQGHLNAWRKNRGLALLTVDGGYGERTHIAVQSFQRHYGLAADGDCGPQTWSKVHAITKGARA